MVKLKTVASALGSLGDINKARAAFDDSSRKLADEQAFPPADIRPSASDARTIALRVSTPDVPGSAAGYVPGSAPAEPVAAANSSLNDLFALVHVPATGDTAGFLVLNPSVEIESGRSLASLVDEGGWPVFVAIAEEVLGVRVDHVVELSAEALGNVIDVIGPVAVYGRTPFEAEGTSFVEGTNSLDGASAVTFASAAAVDDAGQTRTRNQRALLRALVQALRQGGLAKDPAKLTAVLGAVSAGVRTDRGLTTIELGKFANVIRQIPQDDVVAVTVPATSERLEDGTVRVSFDAEALPALRQALGGHDLKEFLRYVASLGY
ncbi:transcriptional regulator [Brevibacterium casei]|uniref:LCP family protein n=1 Tax=Brevibacterium casei TaxID=33889 RepID=UPI00186B8849|nr:LCP family protein [Brevibacterium casei]MBE4695228.1 transcriptional regulator [Brevibacterium casei]MBY3578350.1 transcriptional regulator [Brevibacterium casei]